MAKNYAFIDSQNLNLGTKAAGWTLEFRKFRLYLKNKYNIQVAYLFIGQMSGQESLYDRLQAMGYRLIFKPTTQYKVNGKTVNTSQIKRPGVAVGRNLRPAWSW
jgi:hypothetical protein